MPTCSFRKKEKCNKVQYDQLTTELMGLPEWQCELDLCIRYEFDVVHLNFQNFINTQQAQE